MAAAPTDNQLVIGALLAHEVLRNSDGSFTISGWFTLFISAWVLFWAITSLIRPSTAMKFSKWTRQRPSERTARIFSNPTYVRLFSIPPIGLAIFFAWLVLSSAPGQLI